MERDDDTLTSREAEAVRTAFARLRTLTAQLPDDPDRRRLRTFCHRLAGGAAAARRLLSEREVDVLALAATGLRNGEIAERLELAPETVKSYLRSAMPKLGAHTRCEAVVAARRAGLLP